MFLFDLRTSVNDLSLVFPGHLRGGLSTHNTLNGLIVVDYGVLRCWGRVKRDVSCKVYKISICQVLKHSMRITAIYSDICAIFLK